MSYVRKQALQAKASPAISHASEVLTAPPERWKHGQERASHDELPQADRVVDGVQRLLDAGDIGKAEVVAADRWYRDYVAGVLGGRDPERRSSGAAPDPHMTQLVRARALARHNAITVITGQINVKWYAALLIDELSFKAMAERLMPGSRDNWLRVSGRVAGLLTCLPGGYATIDRHPQQYR